MRRISDAEGLRWEVVVGRESWGSLVVLFVPVEEGRVRQAPLPASAFEEAIALLDRMSDDALREMLEGSIPHTLATEHPSASPFTTDSEQR